MHNGGSLIDGQNGSALASFNGTDSVRSATIKRGGNGGRPRSSIQIFPQGPIPGVPAPEVVPISMPTPPVSPSKDIIRNGSISPEMAKQREPNDNGPYKLPLVAKLSKELESGPVRLEPKHSFQYTTTDNLTKKGNVIQVTISV